MGTEKNMIALIFAFAVSANAAKYKRLHDTTRGLSSKSSLVYAYKSSGGSKKNSAKFTNYKSYEVEDKYSAMDPRASLEMVYGKLRLLGGSRRLLQGGFCYASMGC